MIGLTHQVVYKGITLEFSHEPDIEEILQEYEKIQSEKTSNATDMLASSVQKDMWMFYNQQSDSRLNNITFLIKFEKDFSMERFTESLEKLYQKTTAFRITFSYKDDNLYQIVHKDCVVSIDDILAEQITESFIRQEIVKQEKEPFNLSKLPLIKCRLLRCKDQAVAIFTIHHCIFDGMSAYEFTNLLTTLYTNEGTEKISLQDDFPRYQVSGEMSEKKINKMEKFWSKHDIECYDRVLSIGNKDRNNTDDFSAGYYQMAITQNNFNDIDRFCKQNKITKFTYLLSCFSFLLNRYTQSEKFILGTSINTRSSSSHGQIGCYVNVFPLFCELDMENTLEEFFRYYKKLTYELLSYQDCSIGELQKYSKSEQVMNGGLFNVLINYQKNPFYDNEKTCIRTVDIEDSTTYYDIVLDIVENSDSTLSLRVHYRLDRFGEQYVNQLFEDYLNIINAVKRMNLEQKVSEIAYLSERTIHFIEEKASYVQPEKVSTYIDLFDTICQQNKDKPAVTMTSKSITYGELQSKTDQIAKFFMQKGIGNGTVVAVYMERSIEMMISIIGIWRAGAVFLPIAQDTPRERMQLMLSETAASFLVTENEESLSFSTISGCNVIFYEQIQLDNPKKDYNLINHSDLESLAYIIFTSGSTGVPNGVKISNNAYSITMQWAKAEYKYDSSDRILCTLPYSFDAFMANAFVPLVSGSELIMADDVESKNIEAIIRMLEKHKVTFYYTVPSMFKVILKSLKKENCPALKAVIMGGETLNKAVVVMSKEILPEVEIINEYGPTENTIVSTCKREVQPEHITLGNAIWGNGVILLDDYQSPVPIGTVGNICVTGEKLSKGYIGNKKIAIFDFHQYHVQQIYMTGDKGKWNCDGELVYCGRDDAQVKIRGYRIELYEIEKRLETFCSVKAVKVLADKEKDQIFAFVEWKDESMYGKEKELIEYASEYLAYYMIPSRVIQVSVWPMTGNGKIDTESLLKMTKDEKTENQPNTQEMTAEQKLVFESVKEILGTDAFGVDENLMSVGMNSMKAIQLIMELKKKGIELKVKEVYRNSTVQKLAQLISAVSQDKLMDVKSRRITNDNDNL